MGMFIIVTSLIVVFITSAYVWFGYDNAKTHWVQKAVPKVIYGLILLSPIGLLPIVAIAELLGIFESVPLTIATEYFYSIRELVFGAPLSFISLAWAAMSALLWGQLLHRLGQIGYATCLRFWPKRV